MNRGVSSPVDGFRPTVPSVVEPVSPAGFLADRVVDELIRGSDLSGGRFPLWPVNRLFSGFAGADGPVERLLRDMGVDPGGSAPPEADMAAVELVRLLRRSMRLSRDELWGLRPTATRLGTFALACRAAVHATTVGDAVRAAFRVYHGVIDDFTLRVTVDGEVARLVLVDTLPERPGRDMMHIVIMHVVREMIEWLSGKVGWVRQFDFRYSHLTNLRPIEVSIRAPMVCNTLQTCLVIDRAVLGSAVIADERQIARFVASIPIKLVMVVQNHRTVAQRAASHIRASGDWDLGREEVAAAFNMSAATFRRRLRQDIGIGFQGLKDRLRCIEAMRLMCQTDAPLEQVASQLGFAELSSFHRAFKRWTGEGPGTYRHRCRLQR